MLAASNDVIKSTEDAPIGPKGVQGIVGQRGPYVSNEIYNLFEDIRVINHTSNFSCYDFYSHFSIQFFSRQLRFNELYNDQYTIQFFRVKEETLG